MDKLETMFNAQKNFVIDRRTVLSNNTNPEKAVTALIGESNELFQAVILHTLGKIPVKEVAQEMADVMNYLLNLCLIFKIDIFAEVMEKIAYNNIRFPARAFSDGNYEETYRTHKTIVKEQGIKESFYT